MITNEVFITCASNVGALEKDIRAAYSKAKGRYGATRLAFELQKQEIQVSANTVSRYMKSMGLQSKLSKKYRNILAF